MNQDTLRTEPGARTESTERTTRTATSAAAGPTHWPNTLGVMAMALALCTPMLAQAGTETDRIKQLKSSMGMLEGPCPFFDAALVQKLFPNSSSDAKFNRREKPYPSCTYIWKAKAKNTMKMAGRDVQIPSEGRLTITKAPSRVAANDWERVLMGYRNQQLTPVPELGQYAIWSPQRRQLSWIAKGNVFHVAVQDDDQPDAQQKNAMAVAAELMRTH